MRIRPGIVGRDMEWISVEDRLPEDGQEVIVRYESDTFGVFFEGATHKESGYFRMKRMINFTGAFTHWMPIPDLPGSP